ncbi:hypothetical protein [Xenorhabdus hominickii]|uniref:GntR family transcriptional regulator n=1 Tax=Xenorhabdus hominickii TaxID=351679 RepID=A0A2G0Q919_XENHO|nr:hypothetical protein [Xenorhabdus hominickii]AOM41044.1 hypothetical protein A9255_10940 [Xenorhabdus hominickii]PHM55724.1 GntR family transcriptional regulator [Xenorhabdus hominickii]
MLKTIGKYLGGVVTALRPEGGLQIPCLLADEWSEEKNIRQAAMLGIQLPGLSRLYFGEDKKQGWILGYSSLAAYEIEAAMQRLSSALKK